MANTTTAADILKLIEDTRAEYRDDTDSGRSGRYALANLAAELKKRFDDGYLGDLYRTDYVVEGVGEFPHDMLRYTQSWPKDETDSRAMGADCEGQRRVTLTRYHRDPTPHLAKDRWLSKFRWTVVEVLATVQS